MGGWAAGLPILAPEETAASPSGLRCEALAGLLCAAGRQQSAHPGHSARQLPQKQLPIGSNRSQISIYLAPSCEPWAPWAEFNGSSARCRQVSARACSPARGPAVTALLY